MSTSPSGSAELITSSTSHNLLSSPTGQNAQPLSTTQGALLLGSLACPSSESGKSIDSEIITEVSSGLSESPTKLEISSKSESPLRQTPGRSEANIHWSNSPIRHLPSLYENSSARPTLMVNPLAYAVNIRNEFHTTSGCYVSVKDGEVADIPRASFVYPENIAACTYTTLMIQSFGDRFRYRLDLFIRKF
jgi:hypothetical protein